MTTHKLEKYDAEKNKHVVWVFAVSDGLTMVAEYVKYDDLGPSYSRTLQFDEPTAKARGTYKRLCGDGFAPCK